MFKPSLIIAALVSAAICTSVFAEDIYYTVQVGSLALSEGTLPADPQPDWDQWELARLMQPYVVLDGEGEAYVRLEGNDQNNRWRLPNMFTHDSELLVRSSQPGDVKGRLFVPDADLEGMVMVRFSIPASAADASVKSDFHLAKERHYEAFVNREIPGGAWFRHEAREARLAQPGKAADDEPTQLWPDWRRRSGDLSDTYALFTGGRALSENLQLDRVLPTSKPDEENIDINTIEGITVREMDWASLIKDAKPQPDPLAAMIPADQHVIFFPSFDAAVRLADEAEAHGTPILRLMEPRSENARTKERYERQLCLSINGLSRLLGPQVISSVAITGSDPYYRTGTDVAVIFEAKNPTTLQTLLLAQTAAATQGNSVVKNVKEKISGIEYTGARTDDRSICCYIAQIGNAVVVTNSLAQLERLAKTQAGHSPAISSLPEYTFFRNRYSRSDTNETAFVFLSDATIRRWCGPRWRIATSRRTRDSAVMTELQAAHFEALAKGNLQAGPLHTDLPVAQMGDLRLSPQGVASSTYNTLEFLTPIAEMNLANVTKTEADAYNRWRDTYQQNWRQYFDPIGVRFALDKDHLAADLTVMPLILGSEYNQMIQLARGAAIDPQAGDPHEALWHAVLAINTSSMPVQQAGGFAAMMAPGIGANPLSWLGQSIALYADDDPFWNELAPLSEEEKDDFMENNVHRLPLALHLGVKDQLKLAAFLTALRAFAEQTAPGMAIWEAKTHNEQPYVRVTASEQARQEAGVPNLAVHYAASAKSLIISLSESVFLRALDRQAARKTGETSDLKPPAKPWLGTSLALRAGAGAFDLLSQLAGEQWRQTLQRRAWGNIPILNEWKRRFPQHDPIKLHETFWQTRLVCPGGGTYIWNDQYQTMESTVFGSPAAPKEGPSTPPLLESFTFGDFGLDFEEHGLRARTELKRQDKPRE